MTEEPAERDPGRSHPAPVAPIDPVDVAGRVVHLLDTGHRESTYKLATIMALVDICVENTPAADGTLTIPIDEIAHRFVAYYWPQVRTFHAGGRLSQNRQASTVLDEIASVKEALVAGGFRTPEAAREADHPVYRRLVRSLRATVARQPLTHLQTAPHSRVRDDFLFDASAFHKKMRVAEIDAAAVVVLRPGVPEGLRRTATLLRTFVRSVWTHDVVGFNREELDAEDIDGFLFGADRTALRALVDPLRDLQDNRCFYCDGTMAGDVHIDHVVPFSRVPIDGVANLVATDVRCNLAKSASLPVPEHVSRALARVGLGAVAAHARIPVLGRRARSAARGTFAELPAGSLLWRGVGRYEPYDPATVDPW